MDLLLATLGPFKNVGTRGNEGLSINWVLQCIKEVELNEREVTLFDADRYLEGADPCAAARCQDVHRCNS